MIRQSACLGTSKSSCRGDGLTVCVREIRVPDDLDAIGPMSPNDVEDGLSIDDRELEIASLDLR